MERKGEPEHEIEGKRLDRDIIYVDRLTDR